MILRWIQALHQSNKMEVSVCEENILHEITGYTTANMLVISILVNLVQVGNFWLLIKLHLRLYLQIQLPLPPCHTFPSFYSRIETHLWPRVGYQPQKAQEAEGLH